MVVGPSGSGKTNVLFNCISYKNAGNNNEINFIVRQLEIDNYDILHTPENNVSNFKCLSIFMYFFQNWFSFKNRKIKIYCNSDI